MLSEEKREFIEFMMSADVLRFGEFMTKSGRLSPYFINTGNYKTGAQIAKLGHYYAKCIYQVCQDQFDAIFGPAYKGIPLAVAAASALAHEYNIDKPYFYNRKESKDHGEGGVLVGYKPKDGDRIVIVEDVITAGTSLREMLPLLKESADVTVEDMFISVNRCEVGKDKTKTVVDEVKDEFGINVHAIVTVEDIYDYLGQMSGHEKALERMKQYMDKYCILSSQEN